MIFYIILTERKYIKIPKVDQLDFSEKPMRLDSVSNSQRLYVSRENISGEIDNDIGVSEAI